MRRTLCVAIPVALALLGCGGGDDEPRLVVSAASSMTEVLTACTRDYSGAEVRLSFAGSDELAAQIRQGVKPDVYAAANTELPDDLRRRGLLEEPVRFATNELVLAVAKGSDIHSLSDLTRTDTKLAIGSASVPIGSYTRETLAKLPRGEERAILARVRSNEPDVKGIVGKVAQGAADAGFVYVTDVDAAAGKLRAIGLPAELRPTVVYAAGVVVGAREPERARGFVRGLVSGTCARALRPAGFGPPP